MYDKLILIEIISGGFSLEQKIKSNNIMQIVAMIVALEIIAVSINMFYAPAKVAAGGATGIAILLFETFGFNRAVTVLIINILMIILAAIFLNRKMVMKIILGSFILPICLAITPSFEVVSNQLLGVIVGGGVFAVGISILYRIDSSSGGTTVPPLILKKYFRMNTATTLLAIDTIVCIGNIFVAGWEAFILAVFSLVITSIVMNYIETGLDRKKVLYIMSNDKLDALKTMINASNEQHGLTIFDVKGGYTDDNKEMLMVVIDNQDYGTLLRQVHKVDADAFILTYNISEVHGGQFSYVD